MENIDVISILDGMDWRDDFLRSPEAASSTEKLTEIVSNDMSVKDERSFRNGGSRKIWMRYLRKWRG